MKVTKARSCDGKQRHPSKVAAEAAIWALAHKRGAKPSRWNAYQCKYCGGGWHVGHKRKYRGQR